MEVFMTATPAKMQFDEFILGLCSAALSYMGVSESPLGAVEKNLDLAQQNLHIIELLQEKTRGNLTAEEQELIDQVVRDLNVKLKEAATS